MLNYNSGAAGIRTYYDIANQRIEFHPTRSPLRQGSYRALAATANHFARESFMDELAHLVNIDPLEEKSKASEGAQRPLFVNPAFCAFLGFNEEELRGKHCVDFSPSEDAEKELVDMGKGEWKAQACAIAMCSLKYGAFRHRVLAWKTGRPSKFGFSKKAILRASLLCSHLS